MPLAYLIIASVGGGFSSLVWWTSGGAFLPGLAAHIAGGHLSAATLMTTLILLRDSGRA